MKNDIDFKDGLLSLEFQRAQGGILVVIAIAAVLAGMHEVFWVHRDWWAALNDARQDTRSLLETDVAEAKGNKLAPEADGSKEAEESGNSHDVGQNPKAASPAKTTGAGKPPDQARPELPLRWTGALYFLVAAVVIVLPRIAKLNMSKTGISLEMSQQFRREQNIPTELRQSPAETSGPTQRDSDQAVQTVRSDDPVMDTWEGSEVAGGKRIYATVTPSVTHEDFFLVRLTVCDTDPRTATPLSGDVVFHLHPTFGNKPRKAKVQQAQAVLELLAWGAFTVGAQTADGAKLKLDLSTLPAPYDFRIR